MPHYNFRCNDCDTTFELDLSMKERGERSDKKSCPNCTSQELKQLVSFTSVLKGGRSKGVPDCANTCPSAGICHKV